ncbi:MAG: putative Na+/H+ antiporter, partial [Bdellovibrionales bacterium]|nr:putative Na+/H+ antiporter [Bdellovibrionales bacterium]
MEFSAIGIIATVCFALALVFSLASARILNLSDALKDRRPYLSRLLHFAGEPEIVFGMMAAVFLAALMFLEGLEAGLLWMDERNFSEVAFVVVIMVLASTKPITEFAETIIGGISRFIPVPQSMRLYVGILTLGPLLGSLITEPAAMTISALLLIRAIYTPLKDRVDDRLFYSTLGALFVNVSVGGALTHFAAPPVLMIARVWEWDTPHMFMNFGWKAILIVVLNTSLVAWYNRKALAKISKRAASAVTEETVHHKKPAPAWITAIHLGFMALCVLGVHHPSFVIGLFLIFLGFYYITKEEQSPVKIEESILVGFFLGGLVILTAQQGWWLKPILSSIENFPLFLGTLALAPVTDNAAITSLASQVDSLSDKSKYLIAAAAVAGGGMTICANAPIPAG